MFDKFFDEHVNFIKALLMTAAICLTIFIYLNEKYQFGEKITGILKNALIAVAGVALLAYINMGFLHYQGGYFHGHNMFVEYMTAKYFKQIGYRYLGDATIMADEEMQRQLGNINYFRDGQDAESIARPQITLRKMNWRMKFDDKVWQEFKEDLLFFQLKPDIEPVWGTRLNTHWWNWGGILNDYSFNGSPVWLSVVRPLTNIIPMNRFGAFILAYADFAFIIAMGVAIYYAFGRNVALLSVTFLCCSFVPLYSWIGGGLFELDWLLLVVLAVCFMKMCKPLQSGVALAAAVAIKTFPIIFLAPVLLKSAYILWQHKKPDITTRHFFPAFFITLGVLIIFSFVAGPSPLASWGGYMEKVSVIFAQMESWQWGLKSIFLWEGEVKPGLAANWLSTKQDVLNDFAAVILLCQLAVLGGLYLIITRAETKYWESMILTSVLIFALVNVSKIYYSHLILLVPLLLVRFDQPWRITAASLLFGLNIVMFDFITFQSTDFLINFLYCLLLAAVYIYLIYFMWRDGREEVAAAPVKQKVAAKKGKK